MLNEAKLHKCLDNIYLSNYSFFDMYWESIMYIRNVDALISWQTQKQWYLKSKKKNKNQYIYVTH